MRKFLLPALLLVAVLAACSSPQSRIDSNRTVFEKYPSGVQEKIRAGRIDVGFNPEMVNDPQKLVYSNNGWQLRIEQPKRLSGLIQHEWVAGYSPSAKQDTVRLTFVKSIHDIDEKTISKGAVLLDQHPSEKMYEKLVDAGARCILCYVMVNSSAYSNWAMISTLKESSENPIPVFNIPTMAGQRLREELGKGIFVSIKYSCKTTIAQGNPKTVIATLQ